MPSSSLFHPGKPGPDALADVPAALLLTADALYYGGALQPGLALRVSAEGQVLEVATRTRLEAQFTDLPVHDCAGSVLFPGFVNTHSHAFQRMIRGKTLTVPAADRSADFWSWREAMYQAALSLSPEDVRAVTAFCYLEMLKAGITSVAEFHYLHHDPNGVAYSDRNLLGLQVLDAGEAVGLRVCLLPVAYQRAGFGKPALLEQRRFLSGSLDDFLRQLEQLLDHVQRCNPWGARVGLAAHSVRAVPEAWLRPLKEFATERHLPTHIHAGEQTAEVKQCLEATGLPPIALLGREGFLDPSTVVVHATHLTDYERELLAETGAQVSVCPTTERDLGDGLIEAHALVQRDVPLSLGSDSHVQVDFFAEMRCLEGHERLRLQRRNVLVEQERIEKTLLAVPPRLWHIATQAGEAALQMPVGGFAPGMLADAFTVSRSHFLLEGAALEDIPGLLLCAGTPACVEHVYVGGKRVLESGVHPREGAIRRAYAQVLERLRR